MKIINFITEASVIRQILEHLNLWKQNLSRDPPNLEVSTDNGEMKSTRGDRRPPMPGMGFPRKSGGLGNRVPTHS